MGKKGTLTSIFSRLVVDSPAAAASSASPPWPWTSCRDPQTASFRADEEYPCTTAAGVTRCDPAAARHRKVAAAGEMYKTVNSVYVDPNDESCSCFDDEEEEVLDDSFSTTTASEEWSSEAVIRNLSRSASTDGRFFFDQGPTTNFILSAASPSPARTPPPAEEKEKAAAALPDSEKLLEPSVYSGNSKSPVVEESVAVAVDSEDPYGDFRASMEEMVAAHGLHGWAALEELLVWYLRVNAKRNHSLIVAAFVDLLVGLATAASSTAATTTTTTTSSSSTSSSTASTSTSSTTSTSTTTTTEAAAALMEQCGGGNEACASCSSCSCVASDQDEAGGNCK